MRGSGWLLPLAAVLIWIACVGFPVVAVVAEIVQLQPSEVEIRPAGKLLATSVGWSVAVALGAVLLGWLPGRSLGATLHGRGFVALAALLLVPICLPAYIVFFAWWQSWPAETALYQWIVEHQQMQLARQATLYVGLVCWSWPLVSWSVAGAVAATPAQRHEMLMLDGAGIRARFIDRLRCDAPGLSLGALLVFLTTMNNTTCFDLAEVFTFANELRAIEALGANARDVLIAGAPAMLIAAIGAFIAWGLLVARPQTIANRVSPLGVRTLSATAMIWLTSVALPLALFASNIAGSDREARLLFGEFINLYGGSVATTLSLALISATFGAIVSIGMAAAWRDHRRIPRKAMTIMSLAWWAWALTPGTIIALGLEAAYNRTWGTLDDRVYRTSVILNIGHVASFGALAALFGRWAAFSEPQSITDMRQLDGAQTLPGQIRSSWPRLLAAAVGSFAMIFVLALGEIPVTAKVNPPQPVGRGPLALTLLNDMHYQRPQTVMIAAVGMIIIAAIVALLVALVRLLPRTISRSGRVIPE
jgi:ABC-type Fe3+ transport system permease subunit